MLAFSSRIVAATLFVGLAAWGGRPAAAAEDAFEGSELSGPNSILWYPLSATEEQMAVVAQFLQQGAPKLGMFDSSVTPEVAAYLRAKVQVVNLPADVLEDVFAEVQRTKEIEPHETAMEGIIITGDLTLSLDQGADCGPKGNLPASATIPSGVGVVLNGATPGDYSGSTKRVWIIDTGIDNASGLISVQSQSADCTQKVSNAYECQPPTGNLTLDDDIGHGTMIAGIVGAKPNANGGIYGVAPGAKIIVLKIFKSKATVKLSGPPLAAVDRIITQGQAGDVVNISWGVNWVDPLTKRTLDAVLELNKKVHQVGASGIKVVISAGNKDEDDLGWVSLISPASSGSFPSAGLGCSVCTVSAIYDNKNFWEYSNYGYGPPDYAEPGVDVKSLWPGTANSNKVRTCSGTSFAAAHLVGLFVRGTPVSGGNALNDPDQHPEPVGMTQ